MYLNNFPSLEFGEGKKLIVILPSLMDSFKSCIQNEKIIKRQWKNLASHYRLLFISRPDDLVHSCTKEIARSMMEVIPQCEALIGISMGGLIAQHVIDLDPDRVNHLILAMSSSKQHSSEVETLKKWLEMAQVEDWAALQKSNLEVIFNKPYDENSGLRLIVPKPRTKILLTNSIKACIAHDSSDFIYNSNQRTLIAACEFDRLFPLKDLETMSQKMKRAELFTIFGASHGMHGDYLDQLQLKVDQFINES
ncbi:alpha/beta hydrolase [bacterium]|nr:alpha/beta hydrolase [bacterium]